MALRATMGDVIRLMLGQSVRVTIAGLVIGVGLGILLARWLGAWRYGVSPADPVTIAGVATLLGLVAVASGYLPTRRAARIDPATTLRAQ